MKRFFDKSKAAIVREILAVRGLMHLLMKRRNTKVAWTKDEKAEIKRCLKSLSRSLRVLLVFSLPGGALLLPLLALALDRRRGRRAASQVSGRTLPKAGET
jgi:hypothetical protein